MRSLTPRRRLVRLTYYGYTHYDYREVLTMTREPYPPPHSPSRPRLARLTSPPHSPSSRDAGLVLSLSESEETLTLWPHRFRLQLTVRLSAASLTMTLVASNTGHTAFDFQALLVVAVGGGRWW